MVRSQFREIEPIYGPSTNSADLDLDYWRVSVLLVTYLGGKIHISGNIVES